MDLVLKKDSFVVLINVIYNIWVKKKKKEKYNSDLF